MKSKETKAMSTDEIGKALQDARQNLFNLRFQWATARVRDHNVLKAARRQLVEHGRVDAADFGEPRAVGTAPRESRTNHGLVRSRGAGLEYSPDSFRVGWQARRSAPAGLGTMPSLGRFRCRYGSTAFVATGRVVMAMGKPNAPLVGRLVCISP